MIFQHHRFQVWNANQHPYKHNLSEFLYSNPAIPGTVTNVQTTLDYLVAVLYPNTKPAVDTVGDLPAFGNAINDYRIVNDDGDGKAAAYRWEQREGEASPSWHKVADLDFGVDSILQQWNLQTLTQYVSKWGLDDLDASGNAYSGIEAGQRIYGGRTANTHLSLFANSGDGVGPSTGFVQFGDNIRPITNNLYSMGESTSRFDTGWFSGAVYVGNVAYLPDGLDSTVTKDFSFYDNALGDVKSIFLTDTFETMIFEFNLGTPRIYSTTGYIDFNNTSIGGLGSIGCVSVNALGNASAFFDGTTISDFTFNPGSLTSLSPLIDFGANDLQTSGDIEGVTGKFGRVTISANTLAALTLTDNLVLDADNQVFANTEFVAGFNLIVNGTSTLNGDTTVNGNEIRLDNTVEVTTFYANGRIINPTEIYLDAPTTFLAGTLIPDTDDTLELGSSSSRFSRLHISSEISDGLNFFDVTDLMSLRVSAYRDLAQTTPAVNGDSLFWDNTNQVWLASAPDTEITHSTVSGLTTGDAGHTQFVMLGGRAVDQYINGGTASGGSLFLDSTTHVTKGLVVVQSNLAAGFSTVSMGTAAYKFGNVYTTGQFFGFRLENLAVTPAGNPATTGRLVYNSVEEDVYLDIGTGMKRLNPNRYSADTVWDGIQLTQTFAVTDVNSRFAIWQLKDNSSNYEVIYCKIESPSTTQVTITTNVPLPAGAYRLTGVE